MNIINLTIPVRNHFRRKVERRLDSDFAKGDQFQATWTGWPMHGFTHMDAARHILPDWFTTDEISLDRITGPASIIDISELAPNREITYKDLSRRGPHVQESDIILVAADWERRRSIDTPEFWTEAPWLSRSACE